MDELKKALTSAPALNPIDYESEGKIVLSVDSSLAGWGAILQQEEPKTGKRNPAHFESGIWIEAEKKYDAGKLECRGLFIEGIKEAENVPLRSQIFSGN